MDTAAGLFSLTPAAHCLGRERGVLSA